jgi:hypothetical protein
MDDLWGLLVVALFIAFKVVQSIAKKAETAQTDDTDFDPIEPEVILVPDTEPAQKPIVIKVETNSKKTKAQQQKVTKEKKTKAAATSKFTPITAPEPIQTQTDDTESTVNLENVRQGIIWSEILNRKY